MPDDILIYAHIGDLHLTTASEQTYLDQRAIVSAIATELAGGIDFVYVPGDSADDGRREQYALLARELESLPVPVHVITGDHDMEMGNLDAFYSALGTRRLPYSVGAAGVRCLFLDICGPGGGGQDFRIGAPQAKWLSDELAGAAREGARCAIFMHTYPADLKGAGETESLNEAFAAREVLLVDMGHTHYNEIANDGRTIYAATRSTGQVEEGAVGYSIVAIDGRTVSWRFRLLGARTPIVLITAPADRRLATDGGDPDHRPRALCEIRVSVLGNRPIVRVECGLDDDVGVAMRAVAPNRYLAEIMLPSGPATIGVEAEDDLGQIGFESIEIGRREHLEVARIADGSDADAIGAWEDRGILGSQLGPNRNGRQW